MLYYTMYLYTVDGTLQTDQPLAPYDHVSLLVYCNNIKQFMKMVWLFFLYFNLTPYWLLRRNL